MTKDKFSLKTRLKLFVVISWTTLSLTPIFILFVVLSMFLKLALNSIKSEVVMETIEPFVKLLLLWFCTLKLLFKKNRRNIALFICLRRRFKSKKI